MLNKYLALCAAGTLMLSACQGQPDRTAVATAQSNLSDIIHEPIGKAEIHEKREQLVATNMRTPEDGVRSLYQPGVSWQASLDWADHTSVIRLNSINSRLSGEDTTSSLSLDRAGDDQWRVAADFVAPSYRVNVYSEGELVGSLPPNGGQEAVLVWIPWWWWWWIFDFHVYRAADVGMQQCSWELSSPGIEIRQGDMVLRGDRVQIIEDPHESYGGFDEIQVLGNGDVTYVSEAVVIE
jgi:hypothetical protein